MTKRIGVLLSGRGSNFEALAESVAAGRIPGAEIAETSSRVKECPLTRPVNADDRRGTLQLRIHRYSGWTDPVVRIPGTDKLPQPVIPHARDRPHVKPELDEVNAVV